MSNKPQPVMGSVRQFWIQSLDKLIDGRWVLETYPELERLQKDSTHVLEAAPTLELIDKLEAALEAIHVHQCNQELPGGYYTYPAVVTRETLAELRKWKDGLK